MTRRPRLVFFGTPPAAVPALAALGQFGRVELVITQPDRARGRSGRPQASAVKEAAEDWGWKVLQPGRAPEIAGELEGVDLAVVVAYGQILPAEMLDIPTRGFVNVHFSKLPRWRGAAPVQRAIQAGDPTTGVTVIQLDAGMDTGDIVAIQDVEIPAGITAGSLMAHLAGAGAGLLASCLPDLLAGTATLAPQPEAGASIAKKVTVDEARLDPFGESAEALERAVRAFHPDPGAWGMVAGGRLKVLAATAVGAELDPGGLSATDAGVLLGTSAGGLLMTAVQPAGKRPMAATDWARGRPALGTWE